MPLPVRRCLGPALGVVLCLLGGPRARAVTIVDSSTPGYVTGADVYTGVVSIAGLYAGGGSFTCSGALIGATTILTAGQCVAGASSWEISFLTASGAATAAGISGSTHPEFAATSNPSLFAYDLGLIELGAAAPSDAAISSVYDPSVPFGAVGTVVTQVGFGVGGTPASPVAAGTRHAADTVLTGTYTAINGVPTTWAPLAAGVVYGGPSASPGNYGLVAQGDLGAPLYLAGTSIIVGVTSFTNLTVEPFVPLQGPYRAGYTNLTDLTTREGLATPEPGSGPLTGTALAGAVWLLSRRRRQSRRL